MSIATLNPLYPIYYSDILGHITPEDRVFFLRAGPSVTESPHSCVVFHVVKDEYTGEDMVRVYYFPDTEMAPNLNLFDLPVEPDLTYSMYWGKEIMPETARRAWDELIRRGYVSDNPLEAK